MATELKRRSSDGQGSLDISQMIADENDPKQRAFLIVLHSINQSLEANTTTVREISDKLEGHLEAFGVHVATEEKMINQGRGAWKVVAWVISVAQVLASAAWYQQRNDIADLTKAVQTELVSDVQVKTRVDVLEKAVLSHVDAGQRVR